jgi:hypothetical protein
MSKYMDIIKAGVESKKVEGAIVLEVIKAYGFDNANDVPPQMIAFLFDDIRDEKYKQAEKPLTK